MPHTLLLQVRIRSRLWTHELSSLHLAPLHFSVSLFKMQFVLNTQAIHLGPMQIKSKPQLSSKQSLFMLQDVYFDLIIRSPGLESLMPLCHEWYLVLLTCFQWTPEVYSWASEKTTVWLLFLVVTPWIIWKTERLGAPLRVLGHTPLEKEAEQCTECLAGQPGSKSSSERLRHSRDGQTSRAFPSPLQ